MAGLEFVQRGKALIGKKEYQEAVKACRLGLLAHPSDVEGRLVLGLALMSLHRHEEVLAEMRVALELDPRHPLAHCLKGEALLRKGDLRQAEDVLLTAQELDPDNLKVRGLLREVAGHGEASTPYDAGARDNATRAYPHAADVARGFGGATTLDDRDAPTERDSTVPDGTEPDTGVFDDYDIPSEVTRSVDTRTLQRQARRTTAGGGTARPVYAAEEPAGELDDSTRAHRPSARRNSFADSPSSMDVTRDGARDLDDDTAPPPAPEPAAPRRVSASGTIVLDPEEEGVEIAGTNAGVSSRQPSVSMIELASHDVEEVDDSRASIRARPSAHEFDEHGPTFQRARHETPRRPDAQQAMEFQRSGTAEPIRAAVTSQPVPTPATSDSGADLAPLPTSKPVSAPVSSPARRPSSARAQPGAPSRAPTSAARPSRPGWIRYAVIAVIAVLVVVGGVAAGLYYREHRLQQKVNELVQIAEAEAERQTFRGYLQAESFLRAILEKRDSREIQARLARVRAANAFEHGDPPEEAQPLVDALADTNLPDVVLAEAYLDLARADAEGALRSARDAVSRLPADAEAHYVLGRALLMGGDVPAAIEALGKSITLEPLPLAHVALAMAEATAGRSGKALSEVEAALAMVPRHPTATIERARIVARGGGTEGTANAATAGQLELALEDIITAPTSLTDDDRTLVVSRAEKGWASLALAELRLARGDDKAATDALVNARSFRPVRDPRFHAAIAEALLDAGELDAAREEAESALEMWKDDSAPRVWLARVALAEGNPKLALEELDRAGAAGARPQALAVRGQAKLDLGDVEGAASDLDEALGKMPDSRDLVLARARVDLLRGDFDGAVRRADPLYEQAPRPRGRRDSRLCAAAHRRTRQGPAGPRQGHALARREAWFSRAGAPRPRGRSLRCGARGVRPRHGSSARCSGAAPRSGDSRVRHGRRHGRPEGHRHPGGGVS